MQVPSAALQDLPRRPSALDLHLACKRRILWGEKNNFCILAKSCKEPCEAWTSRRTARCPSASPSSCHRLSSCTPGKGGAKKKARPGAQSRTSLQSQESQDSAAPARRGAVPGLRATVSHLSVRQGDTACPRGILGSPCRFSDSFQRLASSCKTSYAAKRIKQVFRSRSW